MTRYIYSLIVDAGTGYPYQAWHLAHSLIAYCDAAPSDIYVQFTPRADWHARKIFTNAGFKTPTITRFGDGAYCNKLSQFDAFADREFDVAVLLDTDTICVADLRPFFDREVVVAKIVDAENPPIETLREIAQSADLSPGEICETDNGRGVTFVGNCNGGMYAVPKQVCAQLSEAWRRWALWLLAHPEPLARVGKSIHVDQVSFWLAIRETGVAFRLAPSNANYFVHDRAERRYFDERRPISLIHYHNNLTVVGAIASDDPDARVQAAIELANRGMGNAYNNALFWNYRYGAWPERGSGIGSRGDNLTYKRSLLSGEGIESARSVLDVGCGDLEVLRAFKFANYVGLDLSPLVLERGRQIFPTARFELGLPVDVDESEWVLCLEVLIHQRTRSEYDQLIDYIVAKTRGVLIVSGYERDSDAIRNNAMVFFHEPLAQSLSRKNKFRRIEKIGDHTDVAVYRCQV